MGNIPDRSSASSRTLKAANLAGSTPCMPRTWMLAREKPHWGVSGVPFMKSTTRAEPTALSMACRVCSESRRIWTGVKKGFGARKADATGRAAACRRALCRGEGGQWELKTSRMSFWRLTDAMIDLDHMLLLCWAFAGGTERGSWIGS
jgi:hypothetical protein